MFHTAEKRSVPLTFPTFCNDDFAWLGHGYYFWYSLDDAKEWGELFKSDTGAFEVFISFINCENVLDTVFNESEYIFWMDAIELAASSLKRFNKPLNLKYLNLYFKEKCTWDEVDGILFQDLPSNERKTKISKLFYKKRIQIVVYNRDIITTFDLAVSKMVKK